jgi:hypothetical protein
VRLVAADLSESVPAGNDVYMLKHFLHKPVESAKFSGEIEMTEIFLDRIG